jgi:hypothetical protein
MLHGTTTRRFSKAPSGCQGQWETAESLPFILASMPMSVAIRFPSAGRNALFIFDDFYLTEATMNPLSE